MDPINTGAEQYGHDAEVEDARPAPGSALPERSPGVPARARVARVFSGDLLLTVNPVDGSEIAPCPPGQEPEAPRPRTPEERAEAARAAAPSVPPGPAAPELPLLERHEQRERLAATLGRGRSARLTGPAGSGRTALLDAVAADCAELAPDGVVRLSGHHRTLTELLHELFTAVRYAPDQRPDRAALPERLADIGAIVVVDDLEFGGAALDELLAAAPECAFLLAAGPDAPAPSPDAPVEEVALTGLGRASALRLLESAVGRPLTEEEANWAGDLWFESEGLPLRFVQAGALLRQRDRLRVTPAEFDAFGALEEAFGPTDPEAAAAVAAAAWDGIDPDVELREIPLPTLGEGAAPAALLASRLGRSAQATLRFAVALGGELPHQAHLPALVGDTHADAALGELLACGLLTPVGGRYRLATGVLTQLLAHGYEHDAADRVHTAAQHYAWWAAHPSVTPERAAAEADALLAALTGLLTTGPGGAEPGTPGSGTGTGTGIGTGTGAGTGIGTGTGLAAGAAAAGDEERHATAVLLARAAAPAFAAGLHWGAWERALRAGQEAARLTGDVAEEAYFHHELGVLAICGGNLERARAELEASIAMRGVLADKRGTVAGRRALALVADLAGEHVGPVAPRAEDPASPPRGTPALLAPPGALGSLGPIPFGAPDRRGASGTPGGPGAADSFGAFAPGAGGTPAASGPHGPSRPGTASGPLGGSGGSGAAGSFGALGSGAASGGPGAAGPHAASGPHGPSRPGAASRSLGGPGGLGGGRSAVGGAAFGDLAAYADFVDEGPTVLRQPAEEDRDGGRRGFAGGLLAGARRNLVAVGAGALLVAVLGTVVTIGATSGNADDPATNRVTSDSTATEGATDGSGGDEPPAEGEAGPGEGETEGADASGSPSGSGSPSPSASGSASPSSSSSSPGATDAASSSGTPSASDSPSPTTAPPTTTKAPTTAPATTRPPTRPSSSSPVVVPPSPSSSSPTASPSATTPSPSASSSSSTPSPSASTSSAPATGSPDGSASASLGAPSDSGTPSPESSIL
ncbi:ATP-binding protein [Streptomyces sp. NPDC020807]|uniref:ATP-binding protein n=1 Tax=Streptomyces sp. NPDC020807 TaxID=3155119 RepID=UPI0033F024B1